MEIVFGLSPWLVIPALLLAAALSLFLYRYRSAELELLGPRLKWIFTTLRFICLFILLLLLLEPLIKSILTKVEKPIVLIVMDQSESMVMAKDSAAIRNGLRPALEKLTKELGDDFQVELSGFDDDYDAKINFDFKGQVSNLGKTTASLASAYASANLGAIVLVSDGIINRGESPIYNLNQIKAPIYTVATGDTSIRVDAAITGLTINRTAFKGNEFPVTAGVKASKLKGRSGKVEILKAGRVVGSQAFSINTENFGKEFNFTLKADQAGLQSYTVAVTTFEGELITKNNSRSFFIDVIENREKIALVYSHMHPDVGALARAIESIENYELVVKEAQTIVGNLGEYSLIIYHQTGAIDVSQRKIFETIKSLAKPMWLFIGPNSDWVFLNQAGLGIKLNGAQGQTQVQARLNSTFQLFSSDVLSQKELYDFPPVSVPFGELSCSPSITPIYYQQLDRIITQVPLLAFNQSAGGRKGFFFGEGIWRWRMAAFADGQSPANFDALISRSIQFLTAEGNKKQLLVNSEKFYEESDDFTIGAELYNAAGQFVPAEEILFELTYNDSVKYNYAFNKGASGYDLGFSRLSSGSYTYKASCTYAGKKLTESGRFIVESSQLEAASTTADHNLLFQIASGSGGKLIYQQQMGELPKLIRENPIVKPISYSSTAVFDAIKLKWICFLVIALLAAEWYMRKRNGLY